MDSGPAAFDDFLNKILDMMRAYLSSTDQDRPVVRYLPADELKKQIDLSLPPDGKSLDDIAAFIRTYLDYSVDTGNRQFFNQLFAGRNLMGMLGDWIAALSNTSMYTYEMAPVGTLIETALMNKLMALAGFSDGDGLIVNGGSSANLVAMLCARYYRYPDVKKNGLHGRKPLAAFVSDQSHYSFLKAAYTLGLGVRHLISVASDSKGKMIPAELERAIRTAQTAGMEPFFVAATAGTTVLGSFDDLVPIGKICRQFGLWFHVDGAYGAPVLFSAAHRHLINGVAEADSLSWDAHKMMGVPLTCSAILINRRPHALTESCDIDGAGRDYIFHQDNEDAPYNLGPKSLQCGRRVDALKLWLSWLYYGDKGYEARMNYLMELTRYTADLVRQHPKLRLIDTPEYVNVCFQYVPSIEGADVNGFNSLLRERLAREGQVMVNKSVYKGQTFIRLVILNPEVTRQDLSDFIRLLSETGRVLETELVRRSVNNACR